MQFLKEVDNDDQMYEMESFNNMIEAVKYFEKNPEQFDNIELGEDAE